MVRRPKADWVLGVWGFWVFYRPNNKDSWNMLLIKIHDSKIFEAGKIKFLIERI
jgi:hypothetical protein